MTAIRTLVALSIATLVPACAHQKMIIAKTPAQRQALMPDHIAMMQMMMDMMADRMPAAPASK